MAEKPREDNRQALQLARSYELPGGPYASSLGTVDVAVLAEVVRGGEDDRSRR